MIIMCTYIAPFHYVLKALYIIITPADLIIPEPSQLPGEHTNALKPVGRAALNTLTRSFTVYSRVPILNTAG